MSIVWIACPKNWRDEINPDNMRCVVHKLKARKLTQSQQDRIRKIESLRK